MWDDRRYARTFPIPRILSLFRAAGLGVQTRTSTGRIALTAELCACASRRLLPRLFPGVPGHMRSRTEAKAPVLGSQAWRKGAEWARWRSRYIFLTIL